MSNIMASIGIEQLKRLEEMATKRQNLARIYDSSFKDSKKINSLSQDYNSVVPHIYPVIIDEAVDRHNLRESLLKEGIETGVHYQPNHNLSYYKGLKDINLPVTESTYPRLLSLPLHYDLSKNDVNRVCRILKNLFN